MNSFLLLSNNLQPEPGFFVVVTFLMGLLMLTMIYASKFFDEKSRVDNFYRVGEGDNFYKIEQEEIGKEDMKNHELSVKVFKDDDGEEHYPTGLGAPLFEEIHGFGLDIAGTILSIGDEVETLSPFGPLKAEVVANIGIMNHGVGKHVLLRNEDLTAVAKWDEDYLSPSMSEELELNDEKGAWRLIDTMINDGRNPIDIKNGPTYLKRSLRWIKEKNLAVMPHLVWFACMFNKMKQSPNYYIENQEELTKNLPDWLKGYDKNLDERILAGEIITVDEDPEEIELYNEEEENEEEIELAMIGEETEEFEIDLDEGEQKVHGNVMDNVWEEDTE